MPIPSGRDLHVDALLTDISIAFKNSASAFIADQVFPELPVMKQSDRYAVYDKASFFRARAQKRGRGVESAGDGWEVDTTPTYFADRYDFHHDIDDDDLNNTDEPFNLMQDASEYIMHALLVKREQIWATNYFGTSIWTTDKAGVASGPTGSQYLRWDESGSDPIKDIRLQADAIQQLTGFRPNVLVVNPQVLTALEENASIVDRFKHTSAASITTDMLAAILRVDAVLVANAVYDGSAPGGTTTMSFIAGKHALLVYRAPRPGLKQPTGGYTFSWRLPETGGALNVAVKSFRLEQLKSERVEGSMAFDMKVISPDLGVFFQNAIS